MEVEITCPKCNSEMEQGFVPIHLNYLNAILSRWHKGHPKKKRWGAGLIQAFMEGGVPIGAYRCKKCGFLEFYAWNQLDPK